MIDSKKLIMTILSLILLFSISCGDRPTGSTADTLPSEYNGNYYVSDVEDTNADFYNWWLIIKGGNIYATKGNDKTTKPTNFETNTNNIVTGPSFKVSGNTYTYDVNSRTSYIFEFNLGGTTVTMKQSQDGKAGGPVSFTKK